MKDELTLQRAIKIIRGAADGKLQGCQLSRKEAEAVMGALDTLAVITYWTGKGWLFDGTAFSKPKAPHHMSMTEAIAQWEMVQRGEESPF